MYDNKEIAMDLIHLRDRLESTAKKFLGDNEAASDYTLGILYGIQLAAIQVHCYGNETTEEAMALLYRTIRPEDQLAVEAYRNATKSDPTIQ